MAETPLPVVDCRMEHSAEIYGERVFFYWLDEWSREWSMQVGMKKMTEWAYENRHGLLARHGIMEAYQ